MTYPTATLEVAFDDAPVAAYYEAGLALGPTGYWRLNEIATAPGGTLADSSGNANTLTIVGSTAPSSQLPSLLAGDPDYSLSGGSPAIVWQGAAPLNSTIFAEGAYTLEIWVNGLSGAAGVGLGHVNTSSPGWNQLNITSALVKVDTGSGTTAVSYSPSPVLDSGTHHFVFVAEGSKLYIDGELVAEGGSDAPATTNGTTPVFKLTVGPVTVDEAAVYPYSLSSGQVVAHYLSAQTNVPITWTDITSYFLGGSQSRGRAQELDAVQAGTLNIRLRNTDRRFDPTNTAGPYYGNLLPMRRLRLKWTVDAVTYTRFLGFVDGWPQIGEGPSWAEVNLTVHDGFEQLAQADVSTSEWGSEGAGARIGHALDACLWPRTDRAIDTGVSTVPASAFTDGQLVSALSHIQDVANGDLGYFFISADGIATYHDRFHRAVSGASVATFGDSASGEIAYTNLVLDPASKDYILNDVTTTADGGTPQRVEDGSSLVNYFRRSASRSVLTTTDSDAEAQSNILVGTHKEPAERVPSMTLVPATSAQWAQVLAREIGDRVTIERNPPGGGSAIEVECYIEGMADDFPQQLTWVTTWQLSPVSATVTGWLLDDTNLSILNETTVLT